jgi:hypothetical protein
VIPEYIDDKTGMTKLSNIRAEITGVDLIQEYCKTNSIQHLLNLPSTLSASSNKIIFSQKTQIPIKPDDPRGPKFRPVDNRDFRFRVGYQYENEWGPHSELVRSIIEAKRWADSKKVFRHLNRVRFSHPTLPIFADITILRTSAKTGGKNQVMIPQYTIQEAKVFQEPESYEVELEIDNSKVGQGAKYNTAAKLLNDVRKGIRTVLSAIQGSNYPIGETDMKRAIDTYQRLIHGEKYDPETQPSCSFIGPSSRTLQIENIVEATEGQIPNIRQGYTVTDKADGMRVHGFVQDDGELYLIDMSMKVYRTGLVNKACAKSLVDGEWVTRSIEDKPINHFLLFDIYNTIGGASCAKEPFAKGSEGRWFLLQAWIDGWASGGGPQIVAKGLEEANRLQIELKGFLFAEAGKGDSIFTACAQILDMPRMYHTDGLILTPNQAPLPSEPGAGFFRQFKWKPAKDNSIDFGTACSRIGKRRGDVPLLPQVVGPRIR